MNDGISAVSTNYSEYMFSREEKIINVTGLLGMLEGSQTMEVVQVTIAVVVCRLVEDMGLLTNKVVVVCPFDFRLAEKQILQT